VDIARWSIEIEDVVKRGVDELLGGIGEDDVVLVAVVVVSSGCHKLARFRNDVCSGVRLTAGWQMAPRSTPPLSKGSYHPPNDAATYRDLLLFEERLKTNAASLQGRKARYQCAYHTHTYNMAHNTSHIKYSWPSY